MKPEINLKKSAGSVGSAGDKYSMIGGPTILKSCLTVSRRGRKGWNRNGRKVRCEHCALFQIPGVLRAPHAPSA